MATPSYSPYSHGENRRQGRTTNDDHHAHVRRRRFILSFARISHAHAGGGQADDGWARPRDCDGHRSRHQHLLKLRRRIITYLAKLRDNHERNVVIDEIPICDRCRFYANVHGTVYIPPQRTTTSTYTPSSAGTSVRTKTTNVREGKMARNDHARMRE